MAEPFSFNVKQQFAGLIREIEILTNAVDENTLAMLQDLKCQAGLGIEPCPQWWAEAKEGLANVEQARRSAIILATTIGRIERELNSP